MLELEAEKSRRSEKIRKALFEEDSNNSSSSFSLSLLDDPINISENIANSLVESPIKNCISSVPSSSNENNEITELQKKIELRSSPINKEILIDHQIEEPFALTHIQDCSTISSMSYITTDYYNIDVQMEEEVYSLPLSESTNADYMESNHVKSLEVKKQKSSAVRKKCFSSVGIQVGRGPLSVQSISHRDDVIHYYTGLGNYAKFQFVYGTLSDYVDRIKYVKGQVNSVEPEDMFLLILMKLRRNIPDFGLSIYFGISEAVVRNIFNTWIHMIYQLWSLIDIWPSREVVDFYMPEGFKKLYPSTRVIVDATEIPIDKPSNPIAQQATFSTYKNKNTVKVLVGGSPDGILCYHSAAYGGSTSDRQIVERSDLVKNFKKVIP
ncbi:uncharacterized protein LOC141523955 [Cotesia typhae]|uniref:uncharacterized protein LOC141523955 n=1 Tax=Cotesia typhae TaxID=2053667 RepID=UPI003D697634